MKTIFTKILAISSIALLMLSGCKKDGTQVTSNGGKAGTLTATSSTLVLDKTRLTDASAAITFNFTQASYGYTAAVTNTLQIDKAGDNWANPTSVTLGTKVLTQGYSTTDFNALILKLGIAGGTTAAVNVRVAQSISTNVTPIYTNVVAMTVTPFNLTSFIYVVGAFNSWSNTAPDSLISATGNGIYVGIINFTAGNNQFLILPAKNYNNKYATTQSSTPTTTVTYNASNNLNAPSTAGQYIVTFNLNTGAITFALADYYSVIGSAPATGTAWSTDFAMKYVNDGTGTWVISGLAMNVGEYKFRQDNQWNNSWGPSATAGMATDSSPTGDGNLQITTAGNYKLTFVMPATTYGTSPLATTSYTAVKQ